MLEIEHAKKVFGYAVTFGLLFFLLSCWSSLRELKFISDRVQEDITFSHGEWDTSSYNADPLLPGTSSIYVLASDGFVIERWKPIAGYLDASDFKHLLAFNEIQTIQTSSQQDWRVISLPVVNEEGTQGVVTVSSYHPLPEMLTAFDPYLIEASHYILSHTKVENNNLSIQDLDQRKIPHFISFQVVNKFNKIVLKGNNTNSIDRLPNFIDPSYVAAELQAFPLKIIRDNRSGDPYLVITQPLLDENRATKGIIVVGNNLSPLLSSLGWYLGLTTCAIFSFFLFRKAFHLYKRKHIKHKKNLIQFDEKNSIVLINDQKISIAYASNQYYLCLATIKQPTKRWEADELLEKLGIEEHTGSWRKIYDAMNQVNKKTKPFLNKKLIILEDKTYRLNPDLR